MSNGHTTSQQRSHRAGKTLTEKHDVHPPHVIYSLESLEWPAAGRMRG